MAFTSDGGLVVTENSAENLGSPGLFAPSGSGALEQQDLPALAEFVLQDVIVRGGERELCEETSLTSDEIVRSEVIGHWRWVTRGAMPQFSVVTLLSVDRHAVLARKIRRQDRAYTRAVHVIDLLLYDEWRQDRPEEMFPKEYRFRLSFPLFVALSALAYRMTDETWDLGREIRRRIDASPTPL